MSLKQKLEELKELYDMGVITEEIWKEKQRQILNLPETKPSGSSSNNIKVSLPEEIGGGTVFFNATSETSVLDTKMGALSQLKPRFAESVSGCVPLEASDFVLTTRAFGSDEDLDEKCFLNDTAKVLQAGLVTENGQFVGYLTFVSGREPCGKKTPDPTDWSKKKQKSVVKTTVDPWSDLIVQGLDGKEMKISSRWVNQRAVVYLLRRFGCVLCQHQSSLLLTLKPKLDQIGVPLIVIGNSNNRFATKYKEGIKWTGEIYVDASSNHIS